MKVSILKAKGTTLPFAFFIAKKIIT